VLGPRAERGEIRETPTRFPTMLTSVHQWPPPFMACADARRVAAGERPRTGVNEPRTEPTSCHATWRIGRVPGGAICVEAISWALSAEQGAQRYETPACTRPGRSAKSSRLRLPGLTAPIGSLPLPFCSENRTSGSRAR
jgi:hypothetical protein